MDGWVYGAGYLADVRYSSRLEDTEMEELMDSFLDRWTDE